MKEIRISHREHPLTKSQSHQHVDGKCILPLFGYDKIIGALAVSDRRFSIKFFPSLPKIDI